MRNLSKRIDQLTRSLRDLRKELRHSDPGANTPAEASGILDQVLETGLVSDLAETVDHLSRFLWSYIDEATHPQAEVDFAQQSKNLVHVTELLRVLRQAATTSPDHALFVTRVTHMVDRHLEKTELAAPEPVSTGDKVGLQRSA